MKKLFVLMLFAVALTACEESELEEAVIEMREEKKQDANFRLFNSHIIGVNNDAPQGKQGDSSSNKDKSKEN